MTTLAAPGRCPSCGYLEAAAGHRISCTPPRPEPMSLIEDVAAWCDTTLTDRGPLHLLNVRPTAAELAAHPKSLNIQAYFAGARYADGELPKQFPRPLTEVEAEAWREGFAEHADTAPQLEIRRDSPSDSTRDALLGILDMSGDSWQAHHPSPVADELRRGAS